MDHGTRQTQVNRKQLQHASETFIIMNTKKMALAASLVLVLFAAHAQEQALTSGPDIGKDCPAFDPRHVSGPDKGTTACPMCKYGYQQGVMIWMNTDSWDNISTLMVALEKE